MLVFFHNMIQGVDSKVGKPVFSKVRGGEGLSRVQWDNTLEELSVLRSNIDLGYTVGLY